MFQFVAATVRFSPHPAIPVDARSGYEVMSGPGPAQRGGVMSFLKSLFGWGKPATEAEGAATAAAAIDHKGFTITATPFRNEGQFQTAGTVTKTIDGVVKEHKFIRADRHASMEDAVTFSLSKGRQIVDEQGDRLFR